MKQLAIIALFTPMLLVGGILWLTAPRAVAPMELMQSMVREAAIFGWRCHERGSEDECAAAVLRIIGGGT